MSTEYKLPLDPNKITEKDLTTAPFDPRFPNTNQTRYCYQSFLDFYRCRKLRGDSYEPCNYFKKCYNELCPNEWVAKWQEQMEAGTFPVKI